MNWLVTTQGVVLRGHHIVMPQALRDRTLAIAHHGHQGVVKTKQLLRTKAWWPKIDQHVETLIKNCLACQSVAPPNPATPLCETEMPSKPWSSLHMDLCGPFLSGESVLVVIDAYSRFPEVDILKSTTAPSIINKLDRIFSTHGFPDRVTSDNGPQFACHEMADYFPNVVLSTTMLHHYVLKRMVWLSPLWNLLIKQFELLMLKDRCGKKNYLSFCSIIVRRHTPRQKWPLQSCYLIEWLTMGVVSFWSMDFCVFIVVYN